LRRAGVTPLQWALTWQLLLLAYHQLTTSLDLFPFNGSRFYSRQERTAEMLVNLVLMGLAVLGSVLDSPGLRLYAVIYYFVLFGIELVIWWLPYVCEPAGTWRTLYNLALAVGTSDFAPGDTLARWQRTFDRIHAQTIFVLPRKPGRITPNLDHLILHSITLVTALATYYAYSAQRVP
jgi:hypothetical protein